MFLLPNGKNEVPGGAGNSEHCEVQWQGWGLNERPVMSRADFYYPSVKTRKKIALDISPDVVLNCNKNIRLHYPSQISHSALSADPASEEDVFKAARWFGPRENYHWDIDRAHPWPLLTKRHVGEMRWLEDVPAEYRFLDSRPLGRKKQMDLSSGNLPTLHRHGSCLLREWDLLICESKAPRG